MQINQKTDGTAFIAEAISIIAVSAHFTAVPGESFIPHCRYYNLFICR